jgi:hypothetical protein
MSRVQHVDIGPPPEPVELLQKGDYTGAGRALLSHAEAESAGGRPERADHFAELAATAFRLHGDPECQAYEKQASDLKQAEDSLEKAWGRLKLMDADIRARAKTVASITKPRSIVPTLQYVRSFQRVLAMQNAVAENATCDYLLHEARGLDLEALIGAIGSATPSGVTGYRVARGAYVQIVRLRAEWPAMSNGLERLASLQRQCSAAEEKASRLRRPPPDAVQDLQRQVLEVLPWPQPERDDCSSIEPASGRRQQQEGAASAR